MDNLSSSVKFIITIVVAVVSTMAWMDTRFITTLEAKDFVKKERVDKLQRIITYQQLQMVWKDIEKEESKKIQERNKNKLNIYYNEEERLKQELQIK